MLTVFTKVMTIFVMIGAGYLANKMKILPDQSTPYLTSLLINISTPCLVISSMTAMSLTRETLTETLEVLVVNALRREKEHYSHQLLDDAVRLARRVGARRTYLIHACHDIGLQKDLDELLPPDIRMAYDGMVVKW